jgi:aldehyde:ferredoxin oxidoreductase
MYGWMGCMLRINLSTGEIKKEVLAESMVREYIGGRGVSTRLLYEEAGPEVNARGSENRLIFSVGPLTGTPIGASRMTITTKSPQTGFINDGNMGGFFPAELKFAGYDGIIVQGRSSKPAYIFIDDDEVSIKSAEHLWGLTTSDTHRALLSEINDPSVKTVCIGPAGENLAINSLLMGDLYHASGRGAGGFVMGSKNLKAIAVHGTKEIKIAEPEKFMEAYEEWWKELAPEDCVDVFYRAWGNAGDAFVVDYLRAIDALCTRNDKEGYFEDAEKISSSVLREYVVRPQSCFACAMPSCTQLMSNKGRILKIHAGTLMALGSNFGVSDMEAIMDNQVLCNEMGLDNYAAMAISWAFEAYEKGLITKKDTGGLELKWGDAKAVREMIKKISYRQDIGDLLAEGVKVASEKIGGTEFALQVKGVEMTTVTPRALFGMGLAYAVNDMGADHCRTYPPYPPNPKAVPPEVTLPFDISRAIVRDIPDEKGKFIKWSFDTRAIINCLETCTYSSRGRVYTDFSIFARALSAATGVEYTTKDFMKIGERICNLERSFNVINGGASRADDTLPQRMLKEPYTTGGSAGVTVPLDVMLDEYYEARHWDSATGRPKKEKLEELGLGFVIEDFQSKGVWKNETV